MHLLGTRFRYGAVAQALHWLTAILVVAAYFMGLGGSEERVYSSAADFTRQTHETLGVAVFAFLSARRSERPAGCFSRNARLLDVAQRSQNEISKRS